MNKKNSQEEIIATSQWAKNRYKFILKTQEIYPKGECYYYVLKTYSFNIHDKLREISNIPHINSINIPKIPIIPNKTLVIYAFHTVYLRNNWIHLCDSLPSGTVIYIRMDDIDRAQFNRNNQYYKYHHYKDNVRFSWTNYCTVSRHMLRVGFSEITKNNKHKKICAKFVKQ